ncbi:MAG: hypothetical protein U0414_12320 [Polyangiaceae bacterium]
MHTRTLTWGFVGCLALAAVTGCGSKSGDGAPSASAASSGAAAGSGVAPSGNGKGIDAPNNDAALVALARKALGCKRDAPDGPVDYSCADMKAWLDSPATEAATAAPTLVNFIEDPDAKVRALGYSKLHSAKKGYAGDKALSQRVIAAIAVEKAKTVDHEVIGYALGSIDMKATGLFDEFKAAFPKVASDTLKRGILKQVVFNNPGNDAVVDFVLALAKDPSPSVRRDAVAAFFASGPERRDDVCKMAEGLLTDSDVQTVEQAANAIAMNTGCESSVYDKLLDAIDATYKAGKLSGYLASKLVDIQRSKRKPTEPQIKRAEELTRTILTDAKVPSPSRTTLISQLPFADKAFAKDLLSKLESDPDANVAKKAKEVGEKL